MNEMGMRFAKNNHYGNQQFGDDHKVLMHVASAIVILILNLDVRHGSEMPRNTEQIVVSMESRVFSRKRHGFLLELWVDDEVQMQASVVNVVDTTTMQLTGSY
ncbi:hypothetical protein FOZ63_030222 [Perkinsus olseni]|uniref:Uncharacterized protein n=1 Tax=Perkinsus olseni TaxID=32597 RepID=A0A7J6QIL4_PEROL|nr:hypothetical protein FOZ62_018839 [Perkinsus olseni]KAF4708205.1 hypothetical protein FOZ63_030222 [Perkinsus olseni]